MKQLNLDTLENFSNNLVLYGAGMIGRITKNYLDSKNIKVNYFCDSDDRLSGKIVDGLEIISRENLGKLKRDMNIFISNKYLKTVSNFLITNGFKNIYDCSKIIEIFDIDNFYSKKKDVFELQGGSGDYPLFKIKREMDFYLDMCKKEQFISSNYLLLKSVDIQITERCSAKCINCCNLMQYYERPEHSEFDSMFRTISRLMSVVDEVKEFRVIGGDAFMHKELHKVIKTLQKYKTKIIIYTNAKIIPKGENLEALKGDNVIVDISNYNNEASFRHDDLVHVLKSEKINYTSNKIVKWQDCGRILPYIKRTEQELKDVFFNCCNSDLVSILHGKLYRCPYSANGTNLKAFPAEKSDFVDLLNENIDNEKLKKEVYNLIYKKDFLLACSYCNGRDYSTKWIKAAEQTKKRLPYTKVS